MSEAIKAVHLRVQSADVTDKLCQYIKEGLAPLGITHLCIEFNPGYVYRCFPELSFGDFGREQARQVAAAAKEVGIEIVPLFMCLGHQGWRFDKNTLLEKHPEFVERPFIRNGDPKVYDLIFYCHSWCASNDDVYKYVFPMIDELMEDFGASCLHVGMDEVFDLAESKCPRCAGKTKHDLFARTVNILHDHIVKEKGWKMMMWADRLNDAKKYDYHAWEGDIWDTWMAIDMIPKDIIMADWHYGMNEKGFKGIEAFLEKGFTVFPAGYRQLKQARFLLDEALDCAKAGKEKGYPGTMAGMMVTSWNTVDNEYLDEMLGHLQNRLQEDDEPRKREGDAPPPEGGGRRRGFKGTASSIVYMAEALKDYKP